jgi:CHASE domain
VVDELHYQTTNVENAFHASSETLTSFWAAMAAAPPYAVMNDFETWGDNIRTQSKVEFLGLAPLVTEKSSWEEYAVANPWYIEGQHNMTIEELASARREEGIAPKIYTYERYQGDDIPQPQQGPGPYAPLWQVNPYEDHKTMIKFDLLSDAVFQRMYETLMETRKPVASPIMDLGFFAGDDTRQPRSVFFQPVYDKGDDETITAILFGVIPWETYLTGILDSEQEKIYVVLENNCGAGENITFFLDGPNAFHLQPGHQLDGVEEVAIATEFDLLTLPHDSSDTSCHYRVLVIPTESLQNTYETDQPMILSAVVAFMFFVTACAFMVYTTYIQNRQKKLLSIATHTSKIVSQLFPAKMRDRILKEAEDQALEAIIEQQQQHAHKGLRMGARSSVKSTASADGTSLAFKIQEHLSNATGSISKSTSILQASRKHVASRPVAELFAETTVFFGDLVGFTQWSANREPSDVFHLLEVLYG